MTPITVWLLVMVGHVHAGGVMAVQPQAFPTEQDCRRLIATVTTPRYGALYCIQTQVYK